VKRRVGVSVLLCGVVAIGAALAAGDDAVPYPEGYRSWRHVKSMVIQEGHPLHGAFGGIHHLYANAKAMQGYSTGRFTDGAVIVFDLLEAPGAGGAITEGKHKVLGVMHRDSRRYAATGGWGFEGFAGDSKTMPLAPMRRRPASVATWRRRTTPSCSAAIGLRSG
jgi:hypothetical protein